MVTVFPEICKIVRSIFEKKTQTFCFSHGKFKRPVGHPNGDSSNLSWCLVPLWASPNMWPWEAHICINLRMEQKSSAYLSKTKTYSDMQIFLSWRRFTFLLGYGSITFTIVEYCWENFWHWSSFVWFLSISANSSWEPKYHNLIIVIIITETAEHLPCSKLSCVRIT